MKWRALWECYYAHIFAASLVIYVLLGFCIWALVMMLHMLGIPWYDVLYWAVVFSIAGGVVAIAKWLSG